MYSNETTSHIIHTGITGKGVALLLAGLLLLTLVASAEVMAAGRVSTYGTLTSIEDDGTVFIDKIGYFVSPLIIVRNYRDESISLSNIKAPQRVYIEYEYSSKGFMITFLREVSG
jgi:hypothetical protein